MPAFGLLGPLESVPKQPGDVKETPRALSPPLITGISVMNPQLVVIVKPAAGVRAPPTASVSVFCAQAGTVCVTCRTAPQEIGIVCKKCDDDFNARVDAIQKPGVKSTAYKSIAIPEPLNLCRNCWNAPLKYADMCEECHEAACTKFNAKREKSGLCMECAMTRCLPPSERPPLCRACAKRVPK